MYWREGRNGRMSTGKDRPGLSHLSRSCLLIIIDHHLTHLVCDALFIPCCEYNYVCDCVRSLQWFRLPTNKEQRLRTIPSPPSPRSLSLRSSTTLAISDNNSQSLSPYSLRSLRHFPIVLRSLSLFPRQPHDLISRCLPTMWRISRSRLLQPARWRKSERRTVTCVTGWRRWKR